MVRSADHLDVFAVGVDGSTQTAAWEWDFADGWHGWWQVNGGVAAPGTSTFGVSRSADHLDIGNLRTYVNEDFLRRTLEYAGYEVNHVVNITDVGHLTSDADDGDDKMEKGAAREGRTVWEIANHYTQAFFLDWERLNLRQPTHWPRATDYIPQQIELVRELC